MKSIDAIDLSFERLTDLLQEFNQPAFRAKQIWQGIYQSLWSDLSDFSNLPLSLREQISNQYSLAGLTLEKKLSSRDGKTHKYLYSLDDDIDMNAPATRASVIQLIVETQRLNPVGRKSGLVDVPTNHRNAAAIALAPNSQPDVTNLL